MTGGLFPIFWTQCWQVSLLIAIVAAVNHMWFRERPRWAYSLWLLVIIKCLVPPIWSSRLSFFSWSQLEVSNAEILETSSFAAMSENWFQEMFGRTGSLAIVGVWAIGVLACLAVTLLRWRLVHLALTRHRVPTANNVREALARIEDNLAIDPAPVYVTSLSIGPAAFGFWNRKLVVPETIVADKTPAELEPILVHELVHIRRGDTFFSILRAVAQSIWWFNPLVWWSTRQASYQCERCVDNDVMSLKRYSPGQYAKALISVLENKCQLKSILGSAGMNALQINERRLRSIMGETTAPSTRERVVRYACIAALAVTLIPGERLVLKAETMVPTVPFNADHLCEGMPYDADVVAQVRQEQ